MKSFILFFTVCTASLQLVNANVYRSNKGVKKVNIQSGMRYDLLVLPQAKDYLYELCRYYVSGQLKVAPEHVSDRVLKLMHKPPFKSYEEFVKEYEELNKKILYNHLIYLAI